MSKNKSILFNFTFKKVFNNILDLDAKMPLPLIPIAIVASVAAIGAVGTAVYSIRKGKREIESLRKSEQSMDSVQVNNEIVDKSNENSAGVF